MSKPAINSVALPEMASRHAEETPRIRQPNNPKPVDKLLAFLGFSLCSTCQKPTPGHAVCKSCWPKLHWNAAHCKRCAVPLPVANAICPDCLKKNRPWRSCTSPVIYKGQARSWLRSAKFHEDIVAMRALTDLTQATPIPSVDVICATPMPPLRLRSRGINPAHEIARSLSKHHQIALELALRTTSHEQQRGKSRLARVQSSTSRFIVHTRTPGKRWLLVDDVMTTGRTLENATQALLNAGAVSVDVYALLRTPLRQSAK